MLPTRDKKRPKFGIDTAATVNNVTMTARVAYTNKEEHRCLDMNLAYQADLSNTPVNHQISHNKTRRSAIPSTGKLCTAYVTNNEKHNVTITTTFIASDGKSSLITLCVVGP